MKLLWLDLETTGLDPDVRSIIQLGMVVTDEHLHELGRFESVVHCHAPFGAWDRAAWDMHEKTGLKDLAAKAPFSSVEVEILARGFLQKHLGEEKATLAGNSVHFDRAFLYAHMPRVLQYVTHRHLDVSVFKVIGQMYGWPAWQGAPAHTALADIESSIASFKAYRSALTLEVDPFAPGETDLPASEPIGVGHGAG
jgi:oligoribonuclease